MSNLQFRCKAFVHKSTCFTCPLWSMTTLWDSVPYLFFLGIKRHWHELNLRPELFILRFCSSFLCWGLAPLFYFYGALSPLFLLVTFVYQHLYWRHCLSILMGLSSPCLLVVLLCQILLEASLLIFNALLHCSSAILSYYVVHNVSFQLKDFLRTSMQHNFCMTWH